MADMNAFNNTIISEFRASGGKAPSFPMPGELLLLTTTGAKSGTPRTAPLVYGKDGETLFVIASKGGAPEHPAWFANLRKQPAVTVELGSEVFEARARVAEGAERDRLYGQQAAQYPNFAEYARKTDRVIPVVVLERR